MSEAISRTQGKRMSIQSALVRSILEQFRSYQWTVQGLGMVRTKIADVGRIHIWDSRLRTQLVSDIHAHPWELRSTIISGELINQRFLELQTADDGLPYTHSRIATGEGGGLLGEPKDVSLVGKDPEFYLPGMIYVQKAEEVHRSIPQDGTVTLLERQQGEPLQETSVYWPRGTQWVTAEPRPATEWEVGEAVRYALSRWTAV